ncbi:hypothetical protein DFH07DRAFT_805428 [Mycena maculata]|uniref:BZIP domain-containing protein n=1 Tax=Mycena maculata TaxID=230809 RepID=A0AAD7JS75_9AGAR|nr:hypothetical protein DFH07DRAFT_805428 [Mycena maculata]
MPSQRRSEEDLTSNDLSHWEHLIFSFDMQNEQDQPNTNPQQHSDSAEDMQTAALLAQLASSNMFPPPLDTPYSTASHQRQTPNSPSEYHSGPSNQRPFVSPPNLTSTSYSPQLAYPFFRGGPGPGALPPPYGQSYNPPSPVESTRGRSRAPPSTQQAGPSTSSGSPDADPDDNDEYDDKRRRNTAASARFRIKKKQRTLDLERSVSDLTGRAEELEREAADLRRENGWLKEIVMLKGGRLAGINLSGNVGYSDAGGRSSERRGKRRDSADDNESDSESEQSGEESRATRSKGKGKAKSKKK